MSDASAVFRENTRRLHARRALHPPENCSSVSPDSLGGPGSKSGRICCDSAEGEKVTMQVAKVLGVLVLGTAVLGASVQQAAGAQPQDQQDKTKKSEKVVVEGKPVKTALPAPPPDSTTENTVTVGGQKIAYLS